MKLLHLFLPLAATACLVFLPCCAPPAADDAAAGKPPAATSAPAAAAALATPPPVVPGSLKARIEAAIEQARHRDLLTTNGFWTVFHGMVGLGPSVTLLNPETCQRVNALDYICQGQPIRGMRFLRTDTGIDVQTGPTFVGQGHQDQFIAELAQWGMPADRVFMVDGERHTYMDFVRHAQARARVTTDQELSWTILVVGQYLGTDISWTNSAGEPLRFEDLLLYELAAPVEQGACGGTHRLFDMNWVYYLHLRRGGKTEGTWQQLVNKLARYRELARKYQNPDGSFSTDFFRGPANASDRQLRMNTTGHIFEWLALSLPRSELGQPWVQSAANNLTMQFLDIQDAPMEGGTLYHAIHGLILYYARVFDRRWLGPQDPPVPLPPGEPAGPWKDLLVQERVAR